MTREDDRGFAGGLASLAPTLRMRGRCGAGRVPRRGATLEYRALDIIFIEALRVDTVIGVYEWERRIRQPVVIDLEMGADVARAAASDEVADTLDYKAVSKRVQQFVGESGFLLVETLAERIAALVIDEFPVPWVRVKLNKTGALRGARGVGVVIERERKPDV